MEFAASTAFTTPFSCAVVAVTTVAAEEAAVCAARVVNWAPAELPLVPLFVVLVYPK